MKLTNLTLGIITAATLLVVGCTAANTVSEESLGLRTTNLYSEKDTVADKTQYKTQAAGTSTKLQEHLKMHHR